MEKIIMAINLLQTTRRLKLNVNQAERIIYDIIKVLVLAMFVTSMGALSVAAIIWGLYQTLIFNNVSMSLAIVAIGVLSAVVFLISINLIRLTIVRIKNGFLDFGKSEFPLFEVIGNIGQSFVSGLLNKK
jgi:hypothetical protein